MWLPMWVFDGNGLTMAGLAVWIRNVAVPCGLPHEDDAVGSGGCDSIQRLHSTLSRISVAKSGTDFTAPEADFVALVRVAGFCPG